LKDLFEEITFWELSAQRIDVKPEGRGAYRVTLHVEAEKLKGDKFGMEHPVPMNEPVEILVYDANHKPLYRASQRILSGEQMIELLVPRPPAGAVIDPDHELLDRSPHDNEVTLDEGGH
ncbi:MAG TPA: hypothetical protein VF911_12145, partial [Thermoanaerobaculia bacterium]